MVTPLSFVSVTCLPRNNRRRNMSHTWIIVTKKIKHYVLYYSILQTQQLRDRYTQKHILKKKVTLVYCKRGE